MTRRATARVWCAVVVLLLATACAGGPQVETWRLIDAELIGGGAPFTPTVLTRIPSAFLAMGTNSDGAIDVWSSPDGEQWTVGTPPEFQPPPGRGYEVRHLVAHGDGAIAIGAETDGTGFTAALVWVSVDGISWRRDTTIDEQWKAPLLGFGGAVTGGDDVFFSDTWGLWQRDPGGRWEYRTLPDGCWINAPLRSWTRLGAMLLGSDTTGVDPESPPPTGAKICAAGPSGEVVDYAARTELAWAEYAASVDGSTVVIGHPFGPTVEELDPPAVIRTDDDGATWTLPTPLPVPEGLTQNGGLEGLLAVDGVLVATGEAGGSGAVPIPVAWTSTDRGRTWRATALPPLGDRGWVGAVASHDGRIVMLAHYGYGPVDTVGIIVNF